ncbi:hypothetical protein LAZ67_5000210, partial [Cordylochernes scorpioides]
FLSEENKFEAVKFVHPTTDKWEGEDEDVDVKFTPGCLGGIKLGGLHNPLNFQLPLTSERRAKDHIISSLSNKLLDFLEDNSLTIVNGRSRGDKDGDFTYISERGSSTIDYCILSQGSLQILLDFKVDDQLYSDHHPLVLTIKGQNFNEKKTKREDYNITRYRWSADGLATFKMKLEELREKNIPASDDLVYTFNQRILEAMSSAKITYSIKGGPRKSKPWFDKDCYDMKKLAKESLKKYRKTNRLEDRECYASSRKKYLALLDLKRKGFDNEKQEILRNAKDSKTFWKTIALYKSTSIIQGEISIQDWLNFYRELMTTEKNLRICNLHNVISQNDPILDSEITNADIYKEIAGLRSNKACGPDGIPNEVLKTLPDSYILLLKQLYNSVMTTGKYPAIWTNSTIHPIFKNGYKNSPSNYRGIALISNVSKLFTSILRSRLEEWVEGRRVIPENQAGFRKERSCIDHIFTLTTLIQLSLRKKRGKLYVFFVDLRKAFDTVPHSLLWKKLYNLGISYQFISTIKSYYEQATIAIRWKGSFTESIKINSGVLQGEPLSPLLFILFITDLIEIYNNSDLPSVNLPEFGDIHLLLYADDIAIIGESRINLQKKIKILKEYLDENLMTLNESKSKIMVFRNGGKPSNKDRWFWNDKPIAITSRYTYLGFPLTPTITTTHPANYFKGKALTAINATHPILIKSKAKSINLSIKLFDTIVRAVLMYAAPVWATEHKDLLDNIQDIFIRRFLNLPRYTPGYLIRLETGRISLSVTALKLTLKYWLRVLNMSSDRLPRICFNRTRELSNASGTPIGFIKKLTNLLNDNGSPALVSCDDPETLRSAITGLLKTAADQSIQNDLTRMDKSKLYSHYKDIHISFMTEGYLLGDFPFPVVRLLAQVRILSSFFRENHTKMLCGEDPTCTFCNSKLQNEITHYIFDCSALKEERRTLMLKTGQLCASLPSIIDNMTQNKYIATAFYAAPNMGVQTAMGVKTGDVRFYPECQLNDNWDDEDPPEENEAPPQPTAASSQPKKKNLKQILAEKEEQKRREDEERRKEEEARKLMTPEEQMAEKLRLRKLQEESDFEMARETFGLTEAPSSDSFESQNPSTKEEFDEFKKLVVDKLQSLEKSALYMPFLEDFMRDLCVNFEAEEVKKLSSVLNALANEKVKSQKGKAKKKAGGKKATLKLDRGNNYMEDYGGDDFEDFI